MVCTMTTPLSSRPAALLLALALTLGCAGPAPVPDTPRGAGTIGAAASSPPVAVAADTSHAALPTITVYKTPTCGCCTDWVDHLRENGFSVVAHDLDDLSPIKAELGIRRELASCHTAVVDGYVVEGHVPADLIARLLTERPAVTGIAVPGMPIGSPGMEGPYSQRYDVLTFDRDGRTTVFARR